MAKRTGRPPHRADRGQPQAGQGARRLWRAADRDRHGIGISKPTLERHYRDELDRGEIKANTKVAESLFRKATGEGPQSVTAAIFWLKTRARWKDPPPTPT